MEAVIIIIILSILGYVIYQSLPATKFKKANLHLTAGNFSDAIRIFDSIFEKHSDAPAKLAECKLQQGISEKLRSEIEAIAYFNEVFEIKNRLTSNADKQKFRFIEAKAVFEVAQINFSNSLSGTNPANNIKKLSDNLHFIDSSTKLGIENDFVTLKNKHFDELAEITFSIGVQNEKDKKLADAKRHYDAAIDYASKSSNSKIISNSTTRTGICKLKNNESIEGIIFDEIHKSPIEYKRDFFYRYSKCLLQSGNYFEAEKVISNHLHFSSSAVDKIKELLRAKKIKVALLKVDKINNDLDNLYEKSFPVTEVKIFYDKLDLLIEEISTILPSIKEKLLQLKPSLFNRLLTNYMALGQFENAIDLIQKYPLFWDNPELLKNLGICCYSFTLQGKLSEKNYRSIISNWLTAVFSDKVILKSMEDTSWDDDYTFSLIDSIGSNYKHHIEIPENVNYDDTSESNISIGSAQRELLQQYESLIQQKVSDNSLSELINNFYIAEKEAIQNIVAIIDKDVLFPTPYFAKTYDIHELIIDELDNDYDTYNDEDSLKAGIPYLKNEDQNSVSKYSSAKKLVEGLLSAIQDEDMDKVKSIVRNKNKSLVEEYKTINESVEDSIYNAFASKIDDDDENEDLIHLMNECINFNKRNEKLKFQYSNFVADYCVIKVNADEIDNFDALRFIQRAYLYSDENPRICKNIITLIRYNLMDILNDRTRKSYEIFKLLDELIPKRSSVFIEGTQELSAARTEILAELRKAGADISLLIDNDIFSGISLNSQRSLTTEGEKMKKVLSYFEKLSDKRFSNSNPNILSHPLRRQS